MIGWICFFVLLLFWLMGSRIRRHQAPTLHSMMEPGPEDGGLRDTIAAVILARDNASLLRGDHSWPSDDLDELQKKEGLSVEDILYSMPRAAGIVMDTATRLLAAERSGYPVNQKHAIEAADLIAREIEGKLPDFPQDK